jgi:hypothetical protein
MADNPSLLNHSSLRVPSWLWTKYAETVGKYGRSPDLRIFMDWKILHPDMVLGEDVAAPHDFLATLRVEPEDWDRFLDSVGDDEGSAELRRYIWWRVQHPGARLPDCRRPTAVLV